VPKDILLLLSLGAGMNRYGDATLIELWRVWGEQVERHWERVYGHESFGAECCREEGWLDEDEALV
jgi:hypothetical protein